MLRLFKITAAFTGLVCVKKPYQSDTWKEISLYFSYIFNLFGHVEGNITVITEL